MNLHPQPHATAEISAIPTLFAEGVVWEPSLDPRFRLFSIPEENQLDQSLGRHLSKPTLHDTTIATENSLKDEEPIYVCIFIFFLSLWIFK